MGLAIPQEQKLQPSARTPGRLLYAKDTHSQSCSCGITCCNTSAVQRCTVLCRALRSRPKSAKEVDLEEMLAFESYRDIIRLSCLGLTEKQGIAHAQVEAAAGFIPSPLAAAYSSACM